MLDKTNSCIGIVGFQIKLQKSIKKFSKKLQVIGINIAFNMMCRACAELVNKEVLYEFYHYDSVKATCWRTL